MLAVATGGKVKKHNKLGKNLWCWFTSGVLPYSRNHETEADKIGLVLMAIAGYNPDQAISFWTRMAASSNGQAPPPEF
jgi:predicted Zn-dependent protease